MTIQIIKESPITKAELEQIAKKQFGDMVKAVVDVEKEIMAIGGELHADLEAMLVHHGSDQGSCWGINLYTAKSENEWIEFNSMINIRPSQGNYSRGVEDSSLQEKIKKIVHKLVIA